MIYIRDLLEVEMKVLLYSEGKKLFSKSGVGMATMHDANHGSFSKNNRINKRLFSLFEDRDLPLRGINFES